MTVINLNPKLATDLLVRLGETVHALGDLRPADILAAKLVYDSTGLPLQPVAALDQLIATLTFIREETAAVGRPSRESNDFSTTTLETL